MTKIKNCYNGKDLNNINVKKGQSYHHAVEEVDKVLNEEEVPDSLFLLYKDIDDEEVGSCGSKIPDCENCTSDPDYIYCGADLPFLGVRKGDTYEDVFEAIDDALKNGTQKDINVSIVNSNGTGFLNIDTHQDVRYTFPDTNITVYDQHGTEITTSTLPSGENGEIVVEIPECEDSIVIIKNSENTILHTIIVHPNTQQEVYIEDSRVNIQSGNQIIATVVVPAEEQTVQNIDPSGVYLTIKDQYGNILDTYTGTVPAGSGLVDTVTVNGEGSSITVENSDGSVSLTENVLYGSNDGVVVFPDTTVTVKDTALNIIDAPHTYPSGTNQEITIADSIVTLKNSEDEILSTTNVLATQNTEITAPDGDVNIYDQHDTLLDSGTVVSGGETNFVINVPEPEPGWNKPSDWLEVPEIEPEEVVAYLLVAVFEGIPNVICFSAGASTGLLNVTTSDGQSLTGVTGAIEMMFDYDDVDPTTYYNGYRQVMVEVRPQVSASQWSSFDFTSISTTYPTIRVFNFLEVNIGSKTSPQIITNHRFGAGIVVYPMLQHIHYYNTFPFSGLYNWLSYLTNIRKITIPPGTYSITDCREALANTCIQEFPRDVLFTGAQNTYMMCAGAVIKEFKFDFGSSTTQYLEFYNAKIRSIIGLNMDSFTQPVGNLDYTELQNLELHGFPLGHQLNGNSMYGEYTFTKWINSLGTASGTQVISISTTQFNSFGGLGSYVDNEIDAKGYNLTVV